MLAAGVHPVTRRPLLPLADEKTCGGCDHHFSHAHNRTWHKCDLNASRGAATDIRVSFPACDRYKAAVAPVLDGQREIAEAHE